MTIKTLPLGMMQTNCYILYDENTKEAAIFDPACNFNIIRREIENLALNVKYIIITHAHFDHIDALDELKTYTNAVICIGKSERDALSEPKLNLCEHFGGSSPISKADILLNDGDELKLADCRLKIIATPGHTPGGICILTGDILVSGDTLFMESVGRTDFPGGSAKALINSIKNKLFVLDDKTKVYPGHGPSTTIGHEKSNNMYVW